jgi:hypothetical protein
MGPIFVLNQRTFAIQTSILILGAMRILWLLIQKQKEMYDGVAEDILKLPVISSSMISEGGNRINGKAL